MIPSAVAWCTAYAPESQAEMEAGSRRDMRPPSKEQRLGFL